MKCPPPCQARLWTLLAHARRELGALLLGILTDHDAEEPPLAPWLSGLPSGCSGHASWPLSPRSTAEGPGGNRG